MNKPDDNFKPLDYVYLGRYKSGGKLHFAIRAIQPDGTLGRTSLYAYKNNMARTIGGVYTGATFDEGGTVRGLKEARWKGRWGNQDDIIEWQTRDEQVGSEVRAAKMEKDAGQVSEIERILLPLRKKYETYRRQADYEGKEALEQAVLRALRQAPRSSELI
jgi:hypothetical protein